MTLWPLFFTALLGAIAWFFQQIWERQKEKQQSYLIILNLLPSFTTSGFDSDNIEKVLSETRSLLLFAPAKVIKSAETFIESVETGSTVEGKEKKLESFILAMRDDCSFLSIIKSAFWTTKIVSTKLVLKSANPRAGRSLKARP